MSDDKPKRERGQGRIFRRGKIWWIQFYNTRGQQVRLTAATDDEKRAEKFLRKKIGAVANGIVEASGSLRYEKIRDAYVKHYTIQGKKPLR